MQMAFEMKSLLPENAVIIPMPNSSGIASNTLTLAKCLSTITGRPVADVLRGNARLSQYKAKQTGKILQII